MSPEMEQLPQYRVQCTRPFAVTGVDFAGPIIIRSGVRNVTGIKAWIALFVCFSTRAVHLEVVEDLPARHLWLLSDDLCPEEAVVQEYTVIMGQI